MPKAVAIETKLNRPKARQTRRISAGFLIAIIGLNTIGNSYPAPPPQPNTG